MAGEDLAITIIDPASEGAAIVVAAGRVAEILTEAAAIRARFSLLDYLACFQTEVETGAFNAACWLVAHAPGSFLSGVALSVRTADFLLAERGEGFPELR